MAKAAVKGVNVVAPKKYPNELRERAVRLYFKSNPRPVIRRLAEQLGVHPEALRTWIRQADSDQRAHQSSSAQMQELSTLRQENAELRRTNDILKAASAVFAQEMDLTRKRY